MLKNTHLPLPYIFSLLCLAGCGGGDATFTDVYTFANGCYSIEVGDSKNYVTQSASGLEFEIAKSKRSKASRFFMKASDLGEYLLYDAETKFLVVEGTALLRADSLKSNTSVLLETVGEEVVETVVVDDEFVSEGPWELEVSSVDEDRYQLKHSKSELYLSDTGTTANEAEAAALTLIEQDDCAAFPELTSDTEGTVEPFQFEDGSVFGFVDTHSHLLTNLSFGGGGVFHGAPFHPLGVEHALPDCDLVHGEDGKKDLMGLVFDGGGDFDLSDLIPIFIAGTASEFNHATDGYPEFTGWPNAPSRATHQMQYYKWIERAYLGGLRLIIQHATTNEVLCSLTTGLGTQPKRFSCNDMVSVDRIIDATYQMERYIDAQEGGPGEGWFRIVNTPEDAREVINEGKLAVVLGIETSNLFDCFLNDTEEFPRCNEADVLEKLDTYYEKGIRAIFPVHKYDNGFSAGDGHKLVIDLGNLLQTGQYSNFGPCDDSIPTSFDRGPLNFPAINKPRADYFADPPFDFSGLGSNPLGAFLMPLPGFEMETSLLTLLMTGPPLEGDFCQQAGLTSLGEFLINQLMERGMIIEVDHLPRLSYKRAYELLIENDYPAAGTHGLNNNGTLYELGGVSKSNFSGCRADRETATTDNGFQNRIQLARDKGGFPAEGFGLDLNGFAGATGPRFGENSGCGTTQTDPVTYPFTSYNGDITFNEPKAGNRILDFNTEGLVHLGLLPDQIQDVRGDGVTDEELEPLFKSAEGYLRMWEKSIRRGAEISASR